MKLRPRYAILGIVLTSAAILVGIALRPAPLDVEVAVVTRGPMQITLDEDGVTRIRHHVEIAAPVSGRVIESGVEVGDTVLAGAVVAEMFPAPLDSRAREQAQAALAGATALRNEANARVQQAEVALDEARRARNRAEQLHRSGAVPQRDLELAADAQRLRERDLDAAAARADAAMQEERRARLSLVSASPGETSRTAPTKLKAPIGGRVLRMFEEHDRVVPAGTPLVEIGDPASIEVVVDVLTRDAGDITPGAPMLVRISDRSAVRARVTRLEPAAFTKLSTLGVEEQRVNVIGQFLEPVSNAGDRFAVDASIVVWQSDSATRAPVSALVPIGSGWGMFVVAAGRAALRKVALGRRGAREVEVLSGAAAGDTVIVHPDERLEAGARIRLPTAPSR